MRGFIWFSGNEVLLLNRRTGANYFNTIFRQYALPASLPGISTRW